MGKLTFIETPIKDLLVIEPKVFGDNRGYFLETYNQNDFAEAGLNLKFVQDNESRSGKGTLRGMHFQINHPQGKLVRAQSGEVFDVAVDIRKGSQTFGKWYGIHLSGENKKMLYVPEGFAHGFLVLSDYAVFVYKCTDFYHPEDEGAIIWNDETVNINWPLTDSGVLLSAKDSAAQTFGEFLKK
jgi:dTDP-4-dehydrorhamnose 3,5-epimerase